MGQFNVPKRPGNLPDDLAARPDLARANRDIQGERRVITILFCDVKGSTALAEQLDPEEWAEIMNGAFKYLITPVYRYGGTVARLMGDAILAFFGAPVAHEDDPQRAVLAGLDIVNDIRPYREQIERQYGLAFDVRVGINTGLVVVGEIGSDLQMEYTAMGDAVNLASRMEQTAQPGTVQVSGDTYRLVATLFEWEALGTIEIRGKTEPVSTYRVVGPKGEPERLRGIAGLGAPLIGRDDEWVLLRQAIAELRAGRGQILFLVGEAGLGKSRLIAELRAEWLLGTPDGVTWIGACSIPYEMTRPYSLFVQIVRRNLGITEDDSPVTVRRKLAASLRGMSLELQAVMTRAVEILLALRSDAAEPQVEGEALKHELFDATLRVWRGLAAMAPRVLVFDDLHWADAASLELLQHLLPLIDQVPILFLCASRPERQSSGWRLRDEAGARYAPRFTEITLAPLSEADSGMLVDELLSISDLPAELRRMILRKAEGNPYFVEEVVRTLIDSGIVTRDGSGMIWRVAAQAEAIAIPDNVQVLLQARIDRLERDARRTLQLASVIGRTFQYRVLKMISDGVKALDQNLETLQHADLIREAGRLPELEYMFRHELTRDAAYQSILLRRRREFHRKVGEAIEQLSADRLEDEANQLAYHFSEAHDHERALKYSIMAGDVAARLYANHEAIAHYSHAIEIARHGVAKDVQLIHLYTRRGRTYEICGQYDKAVANYLELEALAKQHGDRAMELAALIPHATVCSTYTVKFNPTHSKALSERALALAQELNDYRAQARTYWNLMLVGKFAAADWAQTLAFGEKALEIARGHGLREELAYALHDIAPVYMASGAVEKGRAAQAEALALWRELGNLPMLADTLVEMANEAYLVGEWDRAFTLAEEALHISREIGNAWGQAFSQWSLGPLYIERGEFAQGLKCLKETLALAGQANFMAPLVITHILLGWVYALIGDLEQAAELTGLGLALADLTGDGYSVAQILMAHLRLTQSDPDREGGKSLLDQVLQAYLHLVQGDPTQAQRVDGALPASATLVVSADVQKSIDLRVGYFLVFYVIAGEVALAVQAHENALALADHAIRLMQQHRMRVFLPDYLHVRGRALFGLGHVEEAHQALDAARHAAEALGSRRSLWPILMSLSRLEAGQGHAQQAEAFHAQARAVVDYIADHLESPAQREKFMALPAIREVYGSE